MENITEDFYESISYDILIKNNLSVYKNEYNQYFLISNNLNVKDINENNSIAYGSFDFIDGYLSSLFDKNKEHTNNNDDDIEESFEIDLISCYNYAVEKHRSVNQKYGDKDYSVHLLKVYEYARKYIHLLHYTKYEDIVLVYSIAFLHDIIEDTRTSYNDIKKEFGIEVAEKVFNLTEEKGRTRKERHNHEYYVSIKNDPISHFIKICDRLANISSMEKILMYEKENKNFNEELYDLKFKEMFDEMNLLITYANKHS